MTGKLILVSGLSGSGKTTLAKAAVAHIPNLAYFKKVTTRPRRPHEIDTIEYDFVTLTEYERRKETATHWDHKQRHDYYYGADVSTIVEQLQAGVNVICGIAPDLTRIEQTAQILHTQPITIWLDVPAEIAKARVADDAERSRRTEDASIKSYFDHIFTPVNDLQADSERFVALVSSLL